tara:strand:+ start:1489 stop:1911 length:423 start_codon:yes stop_codon:yes gene_type:complete
MSAFDSESDFKERLSTLEQRLSTLENNAVEQEDALDGITTFNESLSTRIDKLREYQGKSTNDLRNQIQKLDEYIKLIKEEKLRKQNKRRDEVLSMKVPSDVARNITNFSGRNKKRKRRTTKKANKRRRSKSKKVGIKKKN